MIPETTKHPPKNDDGSNVPGLFRNKSDPINMLKTPFPTPVRRKKKLRPMHGMFILEAMIKSPKKQR